MNIGTNFLRFCRVGSVDGKTLVAGVLGVECAVGEGKICTRLGECTVGSGLLVAWVVALGFNFMGIG